MKIVILSGNGNSMFFAHEFIRLTHEGCCPKDDFSEVRSQIIENDKMISCDS